MKGNAMADEVTPVRPHGLGWTLLRTITANDAAVPVVSIYAAGAGIRSPFVDLLFRKTGGAWGSFTIKMVEVSDVSGADAGYLVRQAFKDAGDSIVIAEDGVVSGICASGRVQVELTGLATVTSVEVWVRPS